MSGSSITPLPRILVEDSVKAALQEDLGRAGDVTTLSVVPAKSQSRVMMRARENGVIAGLEMARAAFRLIDPTLKIAVISPDGTKVTAGQDVAAIEGKSQSILMAERVALNFLGHLSGIASCVNRIVTSIGDAKAKICCTRKTTPGLRAFEKYAVRAGGGMNHRFGLDDAILIKDNHIAMAGGVAEALNAAKASAGHLVKIEIEVDSLDQLKTVIDLGADAVLLDNMSPDTLREAVALVDGRMITEASGGITEETAPAIAASGVDLISVGWVTHSAPCLDIGLDFDQSVD